MSVEEDSLILDKKKKKENIQKKRDSHVTVQNFTHQVYRHID